MKFGVVPVIDALGAVLAHGVKNNEGVFKKGRLISKDDITILQHSGVSQVSVARLDSNDVGEDTAAHQLALVSAGQGVIAQQAFTGRANLHSSVYGLVVVDRGRVNAINHIDESLTLATLPSHSVVQPKQMLATVKIIPFAVKDAVLNTALHIVGEQPLMHVQLFQKKHIGLIITTVAQTKATIVAKSEASIRERLQALGLDIETVEVVPHIQTDVEQSIRTLHAQGSDCILVFGASAIVDRGDVIPAALVAAGGEVVHLGMPVDPGNLLMLGRWGEVPVIGVPSCARSPKRNGFDWVLERILVGIHVSGDDIKDMGVGGLLAEIPSRPSPRERQMSVGTRVVAVVLAAGMGRRMGGSKMLADFDGAPLVAATIDNLRASTVDEIIVVTGHEADKVAAAVQGHKVRVVYNSDFESGMASSLRVGVEAAGTADAVVVCLGDMPLVSATVVDRMIAAFNPIEYRTIVVPTHKGLYGNPVLWGAEHFELLSRQQGDKGARSFIAELKDLAIEIEADASVLLDADTPEELAGLRKPLIS